jgi:hypothetical protein
MEKKLNTIESYVFLAGQLIFCLAFLSMCEIPNWAWGDKNPNACLERWMFTGGVFFPSGAEAVLRNKSISGTGQNKKV